ncbi:MAG TPA: hypothetical protein VJ732_00105 [Bryobacteraceae bacterium]|nr:hypothetical protein [Bryobacteraceae bacterium]
MSIRTTVTLDDDVLERVKQESRVRGASFRDTLNDLLRLALAYPKREAKRGRFRVKPTHMGWRPELNYDCIGGLLDFAEGEDRR